MTSSYHVYLRRYAPFVSFGGGFEGDNRGFSMMPDAPSRTSGVASLGPRPSSLHAKASSSGSAWVGPWDVRRRIPWLPGSIGTARSHVRAEVSKVVSRPGTVTFTLMTEGNLPLKDLMLPGFAAEAIDSVTDWFVPGSRPLEGTPDIDSFLDIEVASTGGRITFSGTLRGDGFPNAEVFVLDDRGTGIALVDYRTASNEAGPLYRLFDTGEKNTLATFRQEWRLDSQGFFVGSWAHPTVVQEPSFSSKATRLGCRLSGMPPWFCEK